jgi:YesN/AraC family two-component response regulator
VVGGPEAPGRAVTVLVVDDQEVCLRFERDLIEATAGFEQVAEARSGPEALRLAAELAPDLMLLDVRMPGMSGIETAQRLPAEGPARLVVLVSVDVMPELPASVGAVASVCEAVG